MSRFLAALVLLVAFPIAGAGASADRVGEFSAWSPDGGLIAFVSGHALDVMRSSDGGGKRFLYSSRDACCTGPIQWASPRTIVFDDDYRVMTLDVQTRHVRKIAGFSDFVVSRDGRWVAGWSNSGGHVPEIVGMVTITGEARAPCRSHEMPTTCSPTSLPTRGVSCSRAATSPPARTCSICGRGGLAWRDP